MPGCCSDMKFRQRMAWVGVILYIALSALVFYYLFEISDAFNVYALDHIHTYHTKDGEEDTRNIIIRSLSHVADVPKSVLLTLIALMYLQTFFTLIACTKQEPRFSLAYAWPWFLYSRLRCKNPAISNVDLKASPMEKVVTLAV